MKSGSAIAWKGLMLCVMTWVFGLAVAQAQDCAKAIQICESATNRDLSVQAVELQKAIKLCPTMAGAHQKLADTYQALALKLTHDPKQFNAYLDKAKEEYSTSLKYEKNSFESYFGLGNTFSMMGLWEKAEENYNLALQLRPGHLEASWGLKQVSALKSKDASGLKSTAEILEHFKASAKASENAKLMGFERTTVVKDRVRFDKILFNEWSAEINKPEAVEQLREVGRALAAPELSQMEFVVEGHTDARGDPGRNMKLSWDRSESVKKYLTSHFGIAASRIKTQGFGFSRPRVPNDSPSHLELNRRVEILFMDR